MPLDEEGAKWSCEPCIRGHRSSKCQHFDRLMMKVPKAGRPLAKCPHPKGTCSCQKHYAFMVRIPKGSTCLCRPLYKVPMVVSDSEQQSSQSKSPSQPGSTASSGRVQKRTKRQNSQSTAGSAAKNLSSLITASVQVKNEDTGSPAPDIASAMTSSPADAHGGTSNNGMIEKVTGFTSAQQTDVTETSVPPQKSCCSTVPQPENQDNSSGGCCRTSKKTNCCNGSGKNGATQNTSNGTPHLAAATPTAQYLPSYNYQPHLQNTPMSSNALAHQANTYPHLQFSDLIRPGYNPAGFNATPSTFASPNATHQYSGLSQPMMSYPVGGYNQAFPAMVQDPSHNCGCGDGCQCLGCASHPYNETTRQHIQEMGYMMAIGGSDQGVDGNDRVESPNPNPPNAQSHFRHPSLSYGGLDHIGLTHSLLNENERQHLISFPDPPSTGGPVSYENRSEQMLMRPTAYYTVEYPISLLDPCTNMIGTCQCGVNCKCVGCLTHDGHNGVALQPSPPPEHRNAATFNGNAPNSNAPHSVSSPLQRPVHDFSVFNGYNAYPATSGPSDPSPV